MKIVIFSSVPPSNDAGCCMTTTSYVQAAGGYASDNKEYLKIDTCADDPMIDGEMIKENEEVRLFQFKEKIPIFSCIILFEIWKFDAFYQHFPFPNMNELWSDEE